MNVCIERTNDQKNFRIKNIPVDIFTYNTYTHTHPHKLTIHENRRPPSNGEEVEVVTVSTVFAPVCSAVVSADVVLPAASTVTQ